MDDTLTSKLAGRLKRLRQDRGWSLDQLTKSSGVSRATLSRLENAEVSPTAEVLSKLATAYALTISRLLSMVEDGFNPVVCRNAQTLWSDPARKFTRRSVSPPAHPLAAEVLECDLKANSCLAYDAPPVPGLEHHLILLEGYLEVLIEDQLHKLNVGDCLRYQLFGTSEFRTLKGKSAKYILVLV